jgi:hypothetical protein
MTPMRSTMASTITNARMAFRVSDAAERFDSAIAFELVSESGEFFMY